MAIGQGELLLTPIQMANLAAIIANKGFYITPHFVNTGNKEKTKVKLSNKNNARKKI